MVNVVVFVEMVVDGGNVTGTVRLLLLLWLLWMRLLWMLRALSVHTVAMARGAGMVAAARVLGVVAVARGRSVVAVPFEVFTMLRLAAQRRRRRLQLVIGRFTASPRSVSLSDRIPRSGHCNVWSCEGGSASPTKGCSIIPGI